MSSTPIQKTGPQTYKPSDIQHQTQQGEKGSSGFMDALGQVYESAVASVRQEEAGIQKALKGEMSEDELGLLISQADLHLKQLTAISSKFVEATKEISHSVGG